MTFREKYANHWLARLRTLPEPVFRECVHRLQDGESAMAVTRWLLGVPDRGDLREVKKVHTMRRYLEVLRERPAMRVTAVGFVDPEADGAACRLQAAAPSPIPGAPAAGAGQGTVPAPSEDAMMVQLARGRGAAVRMYLVQVGEVDPSRVASTTRDVRAAPAQRDARRARVEFVRSTD